MSSERVLVEVEKCPIGGYTVQSCYPEPHEIPVYKQRFVLCDRCFDEALERNDKEVLHAICSRCGKYDPDDVEERYSYGVYAGRLCAQCAWEGFRDHCGLGPEGQGTPGDLDDPLDED